MKAWFISDIHLKSINERNGHTLLRFLNSLLSGERNCTHLFLVGDIFDLWISNHQAFVRKYDPIVEAIYRLRLKGVDVIYFEGNHDMHLKNYWEDSLGCAVYTHPEYFHLGSYIIRVEHGDLINQNDVGYQRQLMLTRSDLVENLAHKLPGEFWLKTGEFLSNISRARSHKRRLEQENEIRHMMHQHAERSYDEKPFDFVITGHMHVREEYKFKRGDKEISAFNLGSWFDKEIKILSIDDNGASWEKLV